MSMAPLDFPWLQPKTSKVSDVLTRFLVRLVGLHSVTSMSSPSAPVVGGGYWKAHLKNPATKTRVG